MLPIQTLLNPLTDVLTQQNAILVAPPGAGKSTCLPLHLLQQAQWQQQKIVMLQPRRVAAKSIAEYLAAQLNESVGDTVGYRIRGEQKVSANTRLEIVTEGLLTRMLQNDPELYGIGLVIFDEFHERSIHADFSLALCIESQQGLREDLRLLVMSATLDITPLASILPNHQLLQSEGRSYPVELHYWEAKAQTTRAQADNLISQTSCLISKLVNEQTGNILVFLPGAGEIKRVGESLLGQLPDSVNLYPLYGQLDKRQQQQALAPTPANQRKIVLATNIAETSLTIDGITLVIDSGLEKSARFNLKRGINQLQQQRISQASATQRAGRAGRLAAGQCYRLWSEDEQSRLSQQATPQILAQDIAPLMLEAKVWGSELEQLSLIDHPSQAQLQAAQTLLKHLQAIDETGNLTTHGRAIAQLPCHPRLASMLLVAQQDSTEQAWLACLLVALLENHDVTPKSPSAILSNRLEWLLKQKQHPILQQAQGWAKRLKLPPNSFRPTSNISLHSEDLAELVALAYPDFIAKQRGQGRFQLSGAGGAWLNEEDALSQQKWLAVADLMLGKQANARIRYAQPISEARLSRRFNHLIKVQTECRWLEKEARISKQTSRKLGDLVLASSPNQSLDSTEVSEIWQQVFNQNGLSMLPWDSRSEQLCIRAQLAALHFSDQLMPDFSLSGLLIQISEWLLPYLEDKTKQEQLKQLPLFEYLYNRLNWEQQHFLQAHYPEKLKVPTGSQHSLHYQLDGQVKLAVRMQEVFGLTATPILAPGKLTLTMELLSPAQRPLQTTQDLAGFWQGSYKAVQKEMKGRYPKHYWPDDPANAIATNKTKKNMHK